MNTDKFRSALAQTINGLIKTKAEEKPTSVDMGAFIMACKKELVNLQVPVYDIYMSKYRETVVVIELPFCQSCEIKVDPVEFGSDKKEAVLYVDKKVVRRITLDEFGIPYMNKVATALVDYFKRYLLLKNKFNS